MIIRHDTDSLLFLTQPDHARLAAELLSLWALDGFAAHPRRDTILLAAREHDNGWRELDDEIVFDASEGRALDFTAAPAAVKQAVWPRAVDRLAETSAYAAALVARHAVFVYDSNRGDAAWADFFRRMTARVDVLRERAGVEAADLESDYRFLAVADLLSLSFCSAWTEPRTRIGVTVRTVSNVLRVSPAVLGADPVPVRIRARRIAARPYGSASDVRAALQEAPPLLLSGEARPESP